MDRRSALKNISLTLGAAVASPALLNLLLACKFEDKEWKPIFFSETQKHMVKHLVDIILPVSNLPGGLDVDIPMFMDRMLRDVVPTKQQKLFCEGAIKFEEKFRNIYKKEVENGAKVEFHQLLDTYFGVSSEKQEAIFSMLKLDVSEVSSKNKGNYLIYKFLTSVRYFSLYGYYTSEKIGKEVLNYDPVPGVYNGCLPISEFDKSWS
jgi:glucoside 3-dehydrogenase (cytochrome c) hitch-hiker subunit